MKEHTMFFVNRLSTMFFVMLIPLMMLVASTSAAESSHLVKALPGQPEVHFQHYAGLMSITGADRALFYWFFEADHPNATNLPLALWLTGGPGCSSIGVGAMMELGPFQVKPGARELQINKYSWNKVANLIFLDSPHRVGFSKANPARNNTSETGDLEATSDVLQFLIQWFKKYPEYSKNDFYLLGESYGGHYVPLLATRILEHNMLTTTSTINFKGFAIGNPWTDPYHDNRGDTEFYYSHSLISESIYNQLLKSCDFAHALPVNQGTNDPRCNEAMDKVHELLNYIDNYNIYAPVCNPGKVNQKMLLGSCDPCEDSVTQYMQLPKVQKAFHLEPRPWSLCSNDVYHDYRKPDMVVSMLPVYRNLFGRNLTIWIYSGDLDAMVSTISTRSWIKQLNLTIHRHWYAWEQSNQVGGWTEVYSEMTFATVRGAGHMVPRDKPRQALALFKRFLKKMPLPGF